MTIETYKLAFIGGGIRSSIGKIHSIASTMDKRWEICSGIFSKRNKINIETAKLYGVNRNRVYNNFDNFIKYEKNKIDAVVLILPTPIRSKYLKRLLKLKIPVISEKPLIDNYNDYKFLKRFKKIL